MKKWTPAPVQIAPRSAMGVVRSVVAGGMGRGCPDTLDTLYMCSVAAKDAN